MTEPVKTTEDYNDLIGEMKAHLCAHLEEHVASMLNSADEELFNMAESADNNEDQARCFELMKQLRNIRNILSKNFIKKVAEYLKSYTESEPQTSNLISTVEELSLVGQEEMEDMVLIKSMGTQATGAYREKLSHLEKRFEDLALKTPAIFEKNALNPINFCQAFNDTLGIIFDLQSKKILFKFFETHTINTLGTVYDDINQMMIDAGILPEIKLSGGTSEKARKKPSKPADAQAINEHGYDVGDDFPESFSAGSSGGHATDASAQPHAGTSGSKTTSGSPTVIDNMRDSSSNDEIGNTQGTQSHGGYAMTATPGMSPYHDANLPGYGTGSGTGGEAGTDAAAGGSSGFGGGVRSATGTGGGFETSGGSAGTGGGAGIRSGDTAGAVSSIKTDGHQSSYQHQTAGMPASHVDYVLSNYFGSPVTGGTPSSTDESSIAGQTAGSTQYLGHSEILKALSDIQRQPEYIRPTELKFDANAIKQAVLSTIAKQSGGVVTKRINQIAEKTIDFIEMIFDAIIDDDSISDTIKTLLLRLQIPVIKASMLDQEFFIYDDHPARILLDKMTEVGIGVTDRDNEIYATLDKIVYKLVSEYDLHTETYQTALDELNKFIKRRERIARDKEEAEQQKVLKEHARNTILKTLRSVTKNKRLPESVHALVLRRWPTLLFNHYIDNGKENDAWVRIVEILRDIIESIQPLETAEDLAQMKSVRVGLTEITREYLSRTNQSKKDLDIIISDLEATYDVMEERANFGTEEISTADEAISKEGPRGKESLPEVEQTPKQTLPPNVMPGMWFKVFTGEDTRPRRCKLSVIIVEDSNLIFVNHAGEVIIEKSFDTFGEELETYLSKVIMGRSVFDHALNTVITNIHSQK